eukprot:XP_014619684.1 uncharacterized protein LOC106794204 [Glycine max]
MYGGLVMSSPNSCSLTNVVGGNLWRRKHSTSNINYPVSSLVEETYFKIAQLFANRGQQTQAMINFGSQYSEIVFDAMNNGQQKSNTHIVNEFDRHNHTFIITETQSPLETPRPPGRFRVML